MRGLFGGMFDLDRNGDLDAFEKACEFQFMEEMIRDEEKTEFELSGLDAEELGYMEPYERRMALEEAGLDPDEYDF